MAKGAHRPAQRVVLPNGMWVLLYEDGNIKIAGYDRRLSVTEVQTRAGGSHVFLKVTNQDGVEEPRRTSERSADLVTVPRDLADALAKAGHHLSVPPAPTADEDDLDDGDDAQRDH